MRSSGFTKHHIKRDMLALEERDPSLIDLPINLPSIPVLNSILTPLIGGNDQAAQPAPTTTNQSTPTTPAPAPAPTSTQPSGGGGSSGNGGGAKSSAAPPPPVTQPTTGGGSPKQTSAATPQPSASKASTNPSPSASANSPPSPSASSGSGGASGSGSSSGANGGQSNPNDTNYGAGAGNTPENSGDGIGVVIGNGNSSGAGSASSNSGASASSEQATTTYTPGYPVASGTNSYGDTIYPGSSSTITGDPSSPTGFTGSAAVEHKGISTGGIAAIVVVCFFFLLFIILFFVRKRYIARRSERRNRWWFSGRDSSNFSLPGAPGSDGRQSAPGSADPGIASARSSFATNFDQGVMFPLDSPTTAVPFNSALVTPNLPPMAEVRERNSHLIPSASAAARRSSMNSMMSNGSDDNSQYLLAPDVNRIGQEVSTPMSVRPFSPSESFAFPKPPSQSGDAGPLSSDSASFSPRMLSPKTSESTLVHPMNSQPYAMPAAVSIPTLTRQTPSPTEPTPASNPFADPHSQPDPVAAAAEFAAIETICRPFAPTLEDELRVSPGDSVRILKVFDDGWTFVERVGSNEDGAKGLIPVDCLREAGQALPAFLAQKRVSSYAGDKYNYEEMLSNMLEHGTAT